MAPRFYILTFLFHITLFACSSNDQKTASVKEKWKAQWITAFNTKDTVNTWIGFRKAVNLDADIDGKVLAKIAADSKYWLWINEKLVVREGQLKRGPTPNDTYYDEVDIGEYLKKGENVISVLLWYFGKDGFSHKSSGNSGLLFDCQTNEFEILSDTSWDAWKIKAIGNTGPPHPNWRLAESNIRFDAREEPLDFTYKGLQDKSYPKAISLGKPH